MSANLVPYSEIPPSGLSRHPLALIIITRLHSVSIGQMRLSEQRGDPREIGQEKDQEADQDGQ